MKYYYFLLFNMFFFTACTKEDINTYRTNPIALQQAIQACPLKQPTGVSCDQLRSIAVEVNELVYQLQASPQGFGRQILSLQASIATQKEELQKNPNQALLRNEIKLKAQQLSERLAVVKWLESPES